jgi:hypothetical protein
MPLEALTLASNSQIPKPLPVQAEAALLVLTVFPLLSFNSQAKQALLQLSSSSNLYSHLPAGTETLPSQ